ncbi:MAG: esterase family protein [Bacteroidales bacterium]|nr:esterase family protein [Bacteroidales bacterium]
MRLKFYLIPLMLMMVMNLLMSCSNRDKKPVGPKRLTYLDQQYGSRFEAFTGRLLLLPEEERDSVVKEFILAFPQTPVIEADSIVSLYWYGRANTVVLNGDLQHGWTVPDTLDTIACNGFTFFHRTFTLPIDARIDYLLAIDSVTMTDERNPVVTPGGYGPHSQIAMPGFQPDPIRNFREDIAHGILDSIWLMSRNTSVASRMAKIYIPAGYDTLSELPVLYVTDGNEAVEFMQYTTVLDNLLADGMIEPLLVVFLPPSQQHAEYIGGGEADFIQAVCNDFVPMVDRMYKTASLPAKRAIAGISSGGHAALLTVLSRPDVFLMGVGQSPTISEMIYKAFGKLEEKGSDLPAFRIWIDVGKFDLVGGTINGKTFLEANTDLHHELERRGINHVFNVYNDGHQWANWRERTDKVLVYLFGKGK